MRFERELRRLVEAEMDRTAQAAVLLAGGYLVRDVQEQLRISQAEWKMILQRLQAHVGRSPPATSPPAPEHPMPAPKPEREPAPVRIKRIEPDPKPKPKRRRMGGFTFTDIEGFE